MLQSCPNDVLNLLSNTKDSYFYMDIETDYSQNLRCFAFTFDGKTIYGIPILDYNYKLAHSNTHQVLKALAIALKNNTVVIHNTNFDLFVLADKYRIPFGKTYDTLIAQHRCFPDVEKSLGHCTSLWTWEKFHKDTGSQSYYTHSDMIKEIQYCCRDVYTMYLIKQEIDKYAKTIPGLESSISAAMSCIRPYLTATLQGVRVDEERVKDMIQENDRLMMQYNRMINLLIGEDGMKEVANGAKKLGLFAGSNKQCCRYFHELLNYPVVDRSLKTQEPSLGKKALYKLALKHNNPIITLICSYRAVAKETSRLRFEPWIPYHERGTNGTKNKEGQTILLHDSGNTEIPIEA